MSLLAPQASRSRILKHAFNNVAPQDQRLKLFSSNTTPASTDTAATYTEVGAVEGYAYIALSGASWTFTDGNPSHADYAQQTWTFDGTGGSVTVYGYFVIEATSGLLLYAERFSDGPYTIATNGDQIKITPTFNLS